MPPASSSRRSARNRSCSGDSSPDTYSVDTPWFSSRAAHCISSVDLPMPGSPPTRMTEPGTMPPPRTKSNSARPVRQRSNGSVFNSDRRIGGLAVGSPDRTAEPLNRPTASSISEFHVPHASHLPPHFGWSAPHSVQRNTERALDTRRLACRVVVEAGELLLEVQLQVAGRPVALLTDEYFGDALDALVGLGIDRPVVELLSVDEQHDVGVLLDRARFAQVRELRPAMFAAALLGSAGELRKGHHGHVQLLGEGFERAGNVGNLLLPIL